MLAWPPTAITSGRRPAAATARRAGAGQSTARTAADHPQRPGVEVVVMGVGDEDQIDPGEQLGPAGGATARGRGSAAAAAGR